MIEGRKKQGCLFSEEIIGTKVKNLIGVQGSSLREEVGFKDTAVMFSYTY
jgi:hypothetical protein